MRGEEAKWNGKERKKIEKISVVSVDSFSRSTRMESGAKASQFIGTNDGYARTARVPNDCCPR